MNPIWIAAAAVAGPTPTGAVDAIVWAQPFTLATPTQDPNGPSVGLGQRKPATLRDGWLVELRADPALLVPSQLAEPYLYVGTQRAFKLNWDSEGGCLVAIVSGRPDLANTPVFLGAPPAPGQNLESVAAAELARLAPAARAPAAVGAELKANDLREVYAAGMARVAACSATPADQQRAGAF